jgi:hypothetical protein
LTRVGTGQVAPEVRLADEAGREITVPVHAEPTVLIFYRGDW